MNETVLKFDNVYKSFDKTEVLKGINAQVQKGDVIGLIGLNGAGKTTLLETALGFSKTSRGLVTIFGIESTALNKKETKARIGFVPQKDELIETIDGKRYLSLISDFYSNWNNELISRLSQEWDVPLNKIIQKMSLGQRQKLSILSALGHEPDLIILDEPVASLDPLARRQFLKELVDIASSQQRTIVFSTHIVSDLERIASRVWLLKEGSISIDEELDTLKEKSVRIHLSKDTIIPSTIIDDKLINHRIENNGQILIVSDWSAQLQAKIEKDIGESINPEYLSLEEIFLEIHR